MTTQHHPTSAAPSYSIESVNLKFGEVQACTRKQARTRRLQDGGYENRGQSGPSSESMPAGSVQPARTAHNVLYRIGVYRKLPCRDTHRVMYAAAGFQNFANLSYTARQNAESAGLRKGERKGDVPLSRPSPTPVRLLLTGGGLPD